MLVELSTKRGTYGVNVEKILFVYRDGNKTMIEMEDGTPISVLESVDEVCKKCNIIINENTKI